MGKRYDSSRRMKAAEETRQNILKAALKLHWEGITEFGPLAREAGCSLPTVRKNYPTKESLFQDCTRTFGETLQMPDLQALGGIDDPLARLEGCVSELCRIHEAMFGFAWLCVQMRKNSPTLDAELQAYEGLADAMAEIVVSRTAPHFPLIRGLFDFLTYRALRLSGGLSPENASAELRNVIRPLIQVADAPSRPVSSRKGMKS
jgi:AcrR family transcriptional regulator